MDRLFDVIALGELLVDFTQSGPSPQGNPLYEANPGGAPANVLAMLAFANAAAYLVTTRKGAIRSMPERREVEAVLARIKP